MVRVLLPGRSYVVSVEEVVDEMATVHIVRLRVAQNVSADVRTEQKVAYKWSVNGLLGRYLYPGLRSI